MDSYLVISALGRDRPGIVQNLTQGIVDCGCNVNDIRMSVLGEEFALVMLLSGNWNAIAKFENVLARLEENLDLSIQTKRTEPRNTSNNLIPYAVEVVSMDHRGIVPGHLFYDQRLWSIDPGDR